MQQSPWLSVAHKQLEIMGRYMAELWLTPSSRSRVALPVSQAAEPITFKIVYEWEDGTERDEEGNIVKDASGTVINMPARFEKA